MEVTIDREIQAGTQVPICLRFVMAKKLDNDVDAVSYEEEWLVSRQRVVKAKNAVWFFVPKLRKELAYWTTQLSNLKTLKARDFGSGDWDVIALKDLFRNPKTIRFLNDCAQASATEIKLAFTKDSIRDVFVDVNTQEFVVKLQGVIAPTEDEIPARLKLYNVVFGFLRAFRFLSNGGELVHSLNTSTDIIAKGLFLTTRDRLYEILDAGKVPFRVALLEPIAYVYKGEDEEDYDGGSEQLSNDLLLKLEYDRALVGYNLVSAVSRQSGADRNRILGDGNTVLLTTLDRDDGGGPPRWHTHVCIGQRILEFKTRNTDIARLLSPISETGSPLPWAVDIQNKRVYLINSLEHIKMPAEAMLGFGATPRLVPIPDGRQNPYEYVYDMHDPAGKLGRIYEKFNVGRFFGVGDPSESNQVLYELGPKIGSIVRIDGKEQVETLDQMLDRVLGDSLKVWMERYDGTRELVDRPTLQSAIGKLTAGAAMLVGGLPLYQVRILIERRI